MLNRKNVKQSKYPAESDQKSGYFYPQPIEKLATSVIVVLAVCCGFSVANVYYAQPLLNAIATSFHIHPSVVGGLITATHIGSAIALFCVVPLGDVMNRKRLIKLLIVLLITVLIIVGLSQNLPLLLLGMFGVGLLGTAITQGLIAYAATLAKPAEQGHVIGLVQSGVLVGLLMARTLAGIITDLIDWRAVYLLSAFFSVLMLILIWHILPEAPQNAKKLHLQQLIKSMFDFLFNQRILQVRGIIGAFVFAVLSIFWTALVLPLSLPPFEMSHTQVGAFGLVGVVGVIATARIGAYIDRGFGQKATAVAFIILMMAWIPLACLSFSIWALILGIVLLDLAAQAIHVINQNMILNIEPEASSRLIGCYMLFYSAGSGLGAISSTITYAVAGWFGVCILGFVISLLGFCFWLISLQPNEVIVCEK